MSEISAQVVPAAKSSWWIPYRLVAAAVVVHLVLTFLSQLILSRTLVLANWPTVLEQLTIAGLFGFHIGQLSLLASWGAFSGQVWFLRLPRFSALVAWLFLLDALGAYLVEGDIAKSLVEEFAAYELLLILPPLIILVVWRLLSGRRFAQSAAPHARAYQFSTRQLLLITAETAALLALGRIVLSWKAEHFWNGLTGMRPEEMVPIALSLTVVPAVLYGLARHRTWTGLSILTLYLIISSLVLACAQTMYGTGVFGLPLAEDWFLGLFLQWLDYFWVHACAAATILITFYLLRRIGYDFRRRDDGPRERSSSNARNSAASASA